MIADVIERHLSGQRKLKKCYMGKWLETQDSTIKELLDKVQDNPNVSISGLYREMDAAEELPFKLSTFKLHMKGECPCRKVS